MTEVGELRLTRFRQLAMAKDEDNSAEMLAREIAKAKRQISFFGWLLLLAIMVIPLSIAIGSRAAGYSAISFLAGNFVMAGILVNTRKRDDMERILMQVELIDRLTDSTRDAAKSLENYAKINTDHIGMN